MPKCKAAMTPIHPYGRPVSNCLCIRMAVGFHGCTPMNRMMIVANAAAVITKLTVRVANTPR